MSRFSNSNLVERIKQRRRFIRNFNFYFALFVFSVLIYLALFASLSPFNFACRVCHTDDFKSFRDSPHEKLQCASCHAGMTLSSKLNFRILIPAMPGYFIGASGRNIEVSNASCLYCHRKQIQATTRGKSGVRMSHREPLAEGYRCAECHLKDSHPSGKLSKGFFDMLICFECHNGVKAENKCSHCHLRDDFAVTGNDYPTAYKLVHRDLSSHGKFPLRSCGNCHDMSFCASCHVMISQYRIALPHPQDWLGIHGKTTNRENVRACYACHDKKLCLDCHGLEMPHPENYLRVHIDDARKHQEEKCYKCHEKRGCDFCHENHRHPGVPAELLKTLRRLAGFE